MQRPYPMVNINLTYEPGPVMQRPYACSNTTWVPQPGSIMQRPGAYHNTILSSEPDPSMPRPYTLSNAALTSEYKSLVQRPHAYLENTSTPEPAHVMQGPNTNTTSDDSVMDVSTFLAVAVGSQISVKLSNQSTLSACLLDQGPGINLFLDNVTRTCPEGDHAVTIADGAVREDEICYIKLADEILMHEDIQRMIGAQAHCRAQAQQLVPFSVPSSCPCPYPQTTDANTRRSNSDMAGPPPSSSSSSRNFGTASSNWSRGRGEIEGENSSLTSHPPEGPERVQGRTLRGRTWRRNISVAVHQELRSLGLGSCLPRGGANVSSWNPAVFVPVPVMWMRVPDMNPNSYPILQVPAYVFPPRLT